MSFDSTTSAMQKQQAAYGSSVLRLFIIIAYIQ